MKNIKNALAMGSQESLDYFQSLLDECSTVEQILDNWRIKDVLTKQMQKKHWTSVDSLKSYALKRKLKKVELELEKKLTRVDQLDSDNRVVKSLSISVEWKKSQTWGLNPTAFLSVIYYNSLSRDNFESRSVSGCGYCKRSTAIAEVLNQCSPLIRDMSLVKDGDISSKNHSVLGYGSGYAVIPSFEGGVGESSLRRILQKLGFHLVTENSTKTSDFYYYENSSYQTKEM